MVTTAVGLSDVRVLDLSQDIAGPYAACLMGAFGADVIKVEPPGVGDLTRRRGPFANDEPDPNRSAPFLYLNRNKRGVTLDLRTPSGLALVRRLIDVADVVVDSSEPGSPLFDALDGRRMRSGNPAVVVTSVTNFGRSGPYRGYKGGELVMDALGGWIFVTGEPERDPVKPGLFQAQYSAGLNAAIHSLAALNVRQATGEGRNVEVSVMETAAHFVGSGISMYSSSGGLQVRAGSWTSMLKGWVGPRSHPTEIYECKDGHVGVAVQTQGQWEMFTLALGVPELETDPRFATNYSERGRHVREFNAVVAPWFMERTRREIFDLLGQYRIPCGMAYTAEEILEDPQHESVGFFQQLEQADGSMLPFPRLPLRGDGLHVRMARAPSLGEHNREVYTELLGLGGAELASLRGAGVI